MHVIILLLYLTLVAVGSWILRKHRLSASPGLAQGPAERCEATIKAKLVPGLGRNLLSPAAARALPNRRLQKAFGIENAFTSDDTKFIHSFRREVVNLLNLSEAQWHEVGLLLRQGVQSHITSSDGIVNLAKIAQSLSLRLALNILFETDLSEVSENDIQFVADGTNRIWIESKGKHLKQISPFRSVHEISAKDVVHEALYVYPPTRRVHRLFKPSRTATPVLLRGDIEAAHSDDSIWDHALAFDPTRWHGGACKHKDILTFGIGESTCPAKHVFAPRAIGLLVGILLSEFRGSLLYVKKDEDGSMQRFIHPRGRLENGREDYLDVYFRLPN
ncbi:Cytochrome P450 [Ascosphaera apis ARSEF 7405]|uniref:Cytochrome P450 n=1 Tax=Ascosphaera apis ARSEF 7405 TaxID=392613 RepID=A0A167Y5P1_9EURO|nr:Cytochrome P450 [Ascosphaera apis ARSEF 7405]